VICHVGNPWIIDCMEVVYKNPNVYADISGLVPGEFSDQFEKYMKAKLEEMILFTGNLKSSSSEPTGPSAACHPTSSS